jgi:integrase
MDNTTFTQHVMTRLDELIAIQKKEKKGASKFANAKTSFKKAIDLEVEALPSLVAVFTDRQQFNKYGKSYLSILKVLEQKRALLENREPKFNSASASKGALKPIFEIIGKEVKALLVGQAQALAREEEHAQDLKLDGLSFQETLRTLCLLAFPDVPDDNNLATALHDSCNLVPQHTYYAWIKGYNNGAKAREMSVNKQNMVALANIERLAAVPSGTLTKFAPSGVGLIPIKGMKAYIATPTQTKSNFGFSNKVNDQFQRYESHMRGNGSTRDLKPVFHKFQHESDTQKPHKKWTVHGEHGCVTAKANLGLINTYRHWLMSNGYISNPEDLKELVGFAEFFDAYLDVTENIQRLRKTLKRKELQEYDEVLTLGDKDLKEKALIDPWVESYIFNIFVKVKGFDIFTGLDGFVDFDLSYLLVADRVERYITSRIDDGVTTAVALFIGVLKAGIMGLNGDNCYLSMFHAPATQYRLDVNAKESFDSWKKDEKSLDKMLDSYIEAVQSLQDDIKSDNNDIAIGKRNIAHLINAKVRAALGLQGGIKEGNLEYLEIIGQLEKDAQVLGNIQTYGTAYGATQTALLMRMMYQQPMRAGNWASLRVVTHAESIRYTYPCIWLFKGQYHLRVPKRFVKNHRELNTSFSKSLTKHIDNYLSVREARLIQRDATSDKFFIGYNGGKFSGRRTVEFTYKAQKALWPDREFITWGFNMHSLRHLVATLYLADNPNDIFRCAELLQDKPETVIQHYIEVDDVGIATHHSDWAAQYT